MGGTIWTQPSPSDFDRWEQLLEQGEEPATAARKFKDSHGKPFTCSRFRMVDPKRHHAALEMSREARGRKVDENVEKWALAADASDSMRQFWSKRWNIAYAGIAKLEVTGPDGGPVEVQHRERLTLDDVTRRAADLGLAGPSTVTGRVVPAASGVLSAPDEDQPAAGDLPAE